MNNKSLFYNSVFNIIYRLLNVIFPFITSTYIGHILLASGVGKIAYIQNISMYFIILATLGIPNYGIREIAKNRDQNNRRNEIFSELFIINAISTTVCCCAYYVCIFNLPYFKSNLQLFIISGISIILNYINIDWVYQGLEKFKYIAIRSAAFKLLSLIAILMLVKRPSDLGIYMLIYCLGIGGNNILNIINLKRINVSIGIRNLHLTAHIKPIIILFSSVIAIELYTMLDTTMLGVLCNEVNVGYYSNAMKLVKVIMSVITAITGVLLPRLSFYYKKNLIEKCEEIVSGILNIILFLSVPCTIGVILLAPQIMPLFFGKTFVPAIDTLQISSLLIVIIGLSNLFGTQVLLTFCQEKKLLVCTVIGALSNLALNSFLIPEFAQNGAAIASVISELLVTAFSYYFSKEYLNIKVNYRNLLSVGISTIALVASVIAIKGFIESEWIKLITSIGIGAFVYFIVNVLTQNPIVNRFKLILKS